MRNLKRVLSLTLTSVMLLGMMVVGAGAADYTDVDYEKDNVEAIEVLNAVGVMLGDADSNGNLTGKFRPGDPVSRAEMSVIMAKLMDLDYDYYIGVNPFNDMVGHWAEGYVAACYANGIIAGRSAVTYDPSATVTTVEPDNGNRVNVTVGDAQVTVGATNYVYVTSREKYATTIYGYKRESGATSTSDLEAPIVELGEKLYQGDLVLKDYAFRGNTDAFGRPADTWTYQAKEIGTYYYEPDYTFTAKVTPKALYDAVVGFKALMNHQTNNSNDFLDKCFAGNGVSGLYGTKTELTGNGVLTEVYVDGTDREVIVAVTDFYAAEVYRVKAGKIEGEITKAVASTEDTSGKNFTLDSADNYKYLFTMNTGDALKTENVGSQMVGYTMTLGGVEYCMYIDWAVAQYDYAYVLAAGYDGTITVNEGGTLVFKTTDQDNLLPKLAGSGFVKLDGNVSVGNTLSVTNLEAVLTNIALAYDGTISNGTGTGTKTYTIPITSSMKGLTFIGTGTLANVGATIKSLCEDFKDYGATKGVRFVAIDLGDNVKNGDTVWLKMYEGAVSTSNQVTFSGAAAGSFKHTNGATWDSAWADADGGNSIITAIGPNVTNIVIEIKSN